MDEQTVNRMNGGKIKGCFADTQTEFLVGMAIRIRNPTTFLDPERIQIPI